MAMMTIQVFPLTVTPVTSDTVTGLGVSKGVTVRVEPCINFNMKLMPKK